MNYKYSFIFNEDITNKHINFQIGNTYIKLGFEDILNNLDKNITEILKKLFDYSHNFNSGYVDSIVWHSFLATSNIDLPPFKEQYIYLKPEELKDMEITIQRGGRNINTNLSKNDFINNDLKKNSPKSIPLFPINNSKNNLLSDESYLILKKTIYYNNDTEFIFAFLHCIFSTKKKFYLKKCNICDKYYIADKSDNRYCRRTILINGKNVSCDKRVSALKKKKEYLELNTIHRNFLNKMRRNRNYFPEYIEDYKFRHQFQVDLYLKTGNIRPLADFIINYEKSFPMK